MKTFIYGHLTRTPEQRVTPAGLTITKFSVAASRSYKGPDGTQKEEVTFIDVDAFGKQAELIAQHFTKGKPILLEGRLRQDTWETQTGERRTKHSIVLESFHFINTGRPENEPVNLTETHPQPEVTSEASVPFTQTLPNKPLPQKQKSPLPLLPQEFNDDDIPF